MKVVFKMISMIAVLAVVFSLVSCAAGDGKSTVVNNSPTVDDILNAGGQPSDTGKNTQAEESDGRSASSATKVDVDLTVMNSTMVYSEVYNMLTKPDSYKGKSVRMKGSFAVYVGDSMNYYAVLISDATACCSQGIEFVLTNESELSYPDDYPALGTTVTVSGTFGTYMEGTNMYCRLSNAVFE